MHTWGQMGYEYIEHTADIGFKASNTSIEGLFTDCFTALVNVIFDMAGGSCANTVDINICEDDPKMLLKEFLHRLITLLDADNLVPKEIVSITVNGSRLHCSVGCENYDKQRHRLKTLVKAVTYHKLSLQKTGGEWQATVILDL